MQQVSPLHNLIPQQFAGILPPLVEVFIAMVRRQ